MSKNINFYIAVDAMGGDGSPEKVINGSKLFLDNNSDVKLIIFGDKKKVDSNFLQFYKDSVEFIHCEEIIYDQDKPSSVLRSKKDSSMRKALEYIKVNPKTGFVSAGNTGAVTALSKIIIGTL